MLLNTKKTFLKNLNVITIIFFAFLYGSISLVNHYNFKTYALDLGLYTKAMYAYAHVNWADSLMVNLYYENLLGSHFDLYLILFCPLIYLFGTYTLLIIQIVFVLLGGYGVFRVLHFKQANNENLPYWGMLYYYSFFGVFSALSFDYHSVVIASATLPWFFYFSYKNSFAKAILVFIFLLISQENISIWLFFVCLGLFIETKFNNKKIAFFYVWCMLVSITYFISVTQFVIPHFSITKTYAGFLYHAISNNLFDFTFNFLKHPWDSFKLLFINHSNNMNANNVKIEFHLFIFFSGLFFLFKKPYYLVMLVVLYIQKMYHDNFYMWSIAYHYSIEFLPIMSIGVFDVIINFKNKKWRHLAAYIVLSLSIICSIRVFDSTIMFTDKSRIRIYTKAHFFNDFDNSKVHEVLNSIPTKAIVSAQSNFVPHLIKKKKVYVFPLIQDANYIAISRFRDLKTLTILQFDIEISMFTNTKKWNIFFKSNDIVILRK